MMRLSMLLVCSSLALACARAPEAPARSTPPAPAPTAAASAVPAPAQPASAPAPAVAPVPTAAPAPTVAPDVAQVAVFLVPGLDQALAARMAQALAANPGLVKARPELGNGRLSVEFRPAATDAAAILGTLRMVSPEASLQAAPQAAPFPGEGHGGCGNCPFHKDKGACQLE